MSGRRRLGDAQRDDLKRGSNHFGEQAARAFLDGVFDIALESSDRAVRDHEMLYRDDPDDLEVVAVFADRLRDRAELRRHRTLEAARAGRGPDSWVHARAGITDAERAIELHEAATGDPDPFPLWVPSVRLLLAEMHAVIGRPDIARAEADRAIAAYRGSAAATAVTGPDADADARALALAHALMRQADVLAGSARSARSESLEARRESVELVRRCARVGGALWRERHGTRPNWASVPRWRRFSASAVDLALALGPPRPEAASVALLALQDAVEGYAALVPDSAQMLDPQVREDMEWLVTAVEATMAWLEVVDAGHLAHGYEQVLSDLAGAADGDWYTSFAALRDPLDDHLGS